MKNKLCAGLVVVSLMAAAGSAATPGGCNSSLKLTQDGSIAEWTVCRDNLVQNFALPSDDRFGVEAWINDRIVDLRWHPDPDSDADAFYLVESESEGLRFRRTYEQVDDHTLVHTLAVVNVSLEPITARIRLHVGSAPRTSHQPRDSLAELVYGFERAEVDIPAEGWRAAEDGSSSSRFAVTSRHKAIVFESDQPFTVRAPGNWDLTWEDQTLPSGSSRVLRQAISALPTDAVVLAKPGYAGLMYADVWPPLAVLSRAVERLVASCSRALGGPAIAVVLLALLIRLLTLPISLWSARRQREFAAAQVRMKPRIADVKANYRGAEQSERILAIYKENGVSPFSGLKGSVSLFVQIPFLLAVFNVTTYSAIFAGQAFLWIPDLSQSDSLALLPAAIPLLGSQLNALPIALGIVNLLSLRSPQAVNGGASSKLVPVIITVSTVLFFYSFAAALVLYWLTVNTVQAGERRLIRYLDRSGTGEQSEYQAV